MLKSKVITYLRMVQNWIGSQTGVYCVVLVMMEFFWVPKIVHMQEIGLMNLYLLMVSLTYVKRMINKHSILKIT